MKRKKKIDMSAAAVTARLKRWAGLTEAEMLATMMREALNEIQGECSKKPKQDTQEDLRSA